MRAFLTVAEIEQASTIGTSAMLSGKGGALCQKERWLAHIYGRVIYTRRYGSQGTRTAFISRRPSSLHTGLAIITDVSRAPRARIEAPGHLRRQACGARRRAAERGVTIRYGRQPRMGSSSDRRERESPAAAAAGARYTLLQFLMVSVQT